MKAAQNGNSEPRELVLNFKNSPHVTVANRLPLQVPGEEGADDIQEVRHLSELPHDRDVTHTGPVGLPYLNNKREHSRYIW